MRIRLLVGVVLFGRPQDVGTEHEVSDMVGYELLGGGRAERVDAPAPTAPGVVMLRDPAPQARDPRPRR